MIRRMEFIIALAAWPGLATAQPSGDQPLAANAALKYWQAFASYPELDDREDEIVGEWHEAPLDAATTVIEKGEYALTYLYRGAALATCDWGLDLDKDGIDVQLTHCAKARQLARLALLRSRYRFEQADGAGGVADALAVLKLARDVSSDGLLISWVVRASIEDHRRGGSGPMAIGLLATYLPTLDAETLRTLKAGLEALPPADPMQDALELDMKLTLGSFRGLRVGPISPIPSAERRDTRRGHTRRCHAPRWPPCHPLAQARACTPSRCPRSERPRG